MRFHTRIGLGKVFLLLMTISVFQDFCQASFIVPGGVTAPPGTQILPSPSTRLWVRNSSKNKNKSSRHRKSNDVLSVEKELVGRGYTVIVGSDETGTGAIAGPVLTASCCILTDDWSTFTPIPGVADSKTISPKERERIYNEVVNNPDIYAWAISQRSNEQIDESNVLLATMECFQESIEKVATKLPDDATPYSIVDGKKSPKLSIKVPCRPWVKGDAEVYTVALASILARVTIDKLAREWSERFPEYGFEEHKGYATKDHVEFIHKFGPSPLHRLSFKSLKGR